MVEEMNGTATESGALGEESGKQVTVPFLPTVAGSRPFIWADTTAVLPVVRGYIDLCLMRTEYVLLTQSATVVYEGEGRQMMQTGDLNGQAVFVDAGRVRITTDAAIDLAVAILQMNQHEGFVSPEQVRAKLADRAVNLG
jgi:hypothetical protein